MDQSDEFAVSLWIVRQVAKRSGFSGVKAYMLYVEILKKRYNNVGRRSCDAIILPGQPAPERREQVPLQRRSGSVVGCN